MADHWSDRLPRMMQVCLFWIALGLAMLLTPLLRMYLWARSQYGSKDESGD